MLLAGAALLAGCSSQQQVQSSHSDDSFIHNQSTVPITYTVYDSSFGERLTLAPGEKFTGPGGTWMVPVGDRCLWRPDTSAAPIPTGSDEYNQWTTFTGTQTVIVECEGQ